MHVIYFILLLVAALLLLFDALAPVRTRAAILLLPLALFFWILVPLIQVGRTL